MPIVRKIQETDALFLDTHTAIWLFEGSSELKPNLVAAIEQARGSNNIFISAISFWEIAMLERKNRIKLSLEIEDWSNKISQLEGVRVSSLTVPVLLHSCKMPELENHGDPADKMVIAGAILEKAVLLTRDRVILQIAAASSFLKAFEI
ncbi:MAG: type II toxin-antitoxin system VapC family toxin [Myxococcaceae bacterium]